jgi:hypothetical protein
MIQHICTDTLIIAGTFFMIFMMGSLAFAAYQLVKCIMEP